MGIALTIGAFVLIVVVLELVNSPEKKSRDAAPTKVAVNRWNASIDEVNDLKRFAGRPEIESTQFGSSDAHQRSKSEPTKKTGRRSLKPIDPRLRVLADKSTHLSRLLDAKFAPDSIEVARHRILLDEVRLGLVANIDRENELKKSIRGLSRNKITTELASAKTNLLEQQLSQLDEVAVQFQNLERSNERALHVLDKAIVQLIDMPDDSVNSSHKLDRTVAELEEMIADAHELADTGTAVIGRD